MAKQPQFKTTITPPILMKGPNGTTAVAHRQVAEYQGRGYEVCTAKDFEKIKAKDRARYSNPGVAGCAAAATAPPVPTSDKARRADDGAKTSGLVDPDTRTGFNVGASSDGGGPSGSDGDSGDESDPGAASGAGSLEGASPATSGGGRSGKTKG